MKYKDPPWYVVLGLLLLVVGGLITIVFWTIVLLIICGPFLIVQWVLCKILGESFEPDGYYKWHPYTYTRSRS